MVVEQHEFKQKMDEINLVMAFVGSVRRNWLNKISKELILFLIKSKEMRKKTPNVEKYTKTLVSSLFFIIIISFRDFEWNKIDRLVFVCYLKIIASNKMAKVLLKGSKIMR